MYIYTPVAGLGIPDLYGILRLLFYDTLLCTKLVCIRHLYCTHYIPYCNDTVPYWHNLFCTTPEDTQIKSFCSSKFSSIESWCPLIFNYITITQLLLCAFTPAVMFSAYTRTQITKHAFTLDRRHRSRICIGPWPLLRLLTKPEETEQPQLYSCLL